MNESLAKLPAIAAALLLSALSSLAQPINRHALVSRHNVVLSQPDLSSPLTIGNGSLGFTADITGLQTYSDSYASATPLGTFSQWGWHSFPNPHHYQLSDVLTNYNSHGRNVPYAASYGEGGEVSPRIKAAVAWLRENPHRLDLGRIAFLLRHSDGSPVTLNQLTNLHQELDLWTGQIHSRFTVDQEPVEVLTLCDPAEDVLAFQVRSHLLSDRRLQILLAFPYAAGSFSTAADWTSTSRHTTVATVAKHQATVKHTLDATSYYVIAQWSQAATFTSAGPHRFEISAPARDSLEFTLAFSPQQSSSLPELRQVQARAAAYWQHFWTAGGAIDLSGSTDPRAPELERRIVLSQYLTAINSSGSTPPQETGLEMDSWYGKFHLEMHWWHAAHFALWNRADLHERSMAWYRQILPAAHETAKRQGYDGVRWPKMVGPDGRESPSDIGDFLIWQQPHPIYLAELLYRAYPTRQTLNRYSEIVFQTADFLSSYAFFNPQTGAYVLGPPLVPAQESYGRSKERLKNPTFELAYWQWALRTAQQWRQRLGFPPNPEWDKVARHIALPTMKDGIYTAISVPPFTLRTDHPSMLCALGMLPPTELINANIMRPTLDDVLKQWDWSSTWGWDYGMLAMTAARLGEPEKALDVLLMDTPKNRYLLNGNNYQTPRLPVYLPGNGALLYATALMAAGWDNAPQRPAPGFPSNGKWHVRFENLSVAP